MVRDEIKQAVRAALETTLPGIAIPDFSVAVPENPEHGDYAANVALLLAKAVKKPPMKIAQLLVPQLLVDPFEHVLAAPPGFLNFWLTPESLRKEFMEILRKGKNYGSGTPKKEKINVEFVSANPTGPLTMANGRGGFYGDVLANALKMAGYEITREYYINDAGNQIKLLGESILAELGIAEKKPEHYQGNYIKDYAESIKGELDKLKKVKTGKSNFELVLMGGIQWELNDGKYEPSLPADPERVGRVAVYLEQDPMKKGRESLMDKIKASLEDAGIKFDVWFSESNDLRQKGELGKVFKLLEDKDAVYEKEGAWWLDDNVVKKSDGSPTYFWADLAYHYDKFIKRKFDIAINIWGADHHGYIERMKKGVEALGIDPSRLHIIIMQLVRLVRGGEEIKMSKRKGEFVTLEELVDEVGLDAARFFFLMHSPDSHMDFDLELAKERSAKNPVYYVQYAHARIVSIFKKAKGLKPDSKKTDLLVAEEEKSLIKKLIRFPEIVEDISRDYQVIRLTRYATELARAFHDFYEKQRVITDDKELTGARLALVKAVQIVLQNTLGLLGISAPEKM